MRYKRSRLHGAKGIAFDGKRFKVLVQKVMLPDGRQMHKELIIAPSVAVILPISNGKLVLIRQYRPVLGVWMYEIPAGIINIHETPLQAAKRELEEETGYKSKSIKKMLECFSSPGISNEHAYIYIAECGKKGAQHLDEHENIKVLEATSSDVTKMLKNGLIKNAISALAISIYLNSTLQLVPDKLAVR